MELSFRCWLTEEKKMAYDLFVQNRDCAMQKDRDGTRLFFGDEVKVMQSVGMEDCKGVMIFEGDYIDTPHGTLKVEGIRGFWVLMTLGNLNKEDIDVVGNEWENPEWKDKLDFELTEQDLSQ